VSRELTVADLLVDQMQREEERRGDAAHDGYHCLA
jgi:hypothetical protein